MNDHFCVTIDRKSSEEERQVALRQIYQQVLERQPYEYERVVLAKSEKDFLKGKLGVRHFIGELAISEVYLNSFYEDCSNYKFVELSFKHFLARAPIDNEEIGIYMALLIEHGMTAFVAEILGSEEYRKAFGGFTVPYPRTAKVYNSPRNYMQSSLLHHEHIGRRGKIVPTLYWQQLRLNCENGHCILPDGVLPDGVVTDLNQSARSHSSSLNVASPDLNTEIEELLLMLKSTDARQVVQSLNENQRSLLRDLAK